MERLSDELRRLLSQLRDIESVEVLLFLAQTSERYLSASQVGEALHLVNAEAELEKLARLGLLDVKLGSAVLYRFAPPEGLAGAVEELRREYADRRLLVLSAMRATSYVDSFADAFRIVRRPKGGKEGADG